MRSSNLCVMDHVSDVFVHASRIWGNLKQYDGVHWNCLDGKDAVSVNWYQYDRYKFPNIPPLNKRFKRFIFTDLDNYLLHSQRESALKVLYFYTHMISQGIVAFPKQLLKPEDTITLAKAAGFKDGKRLDDSCVLIHKY